MHRRQRHDRRPSPTARAPPARRNRDRARSRAPAPTAPEPPKAWKKRATIKACIEERQRADRARQPVDAERRPARPACGHAGPTPAIDNLPAVRNRPDTTRASIAPAPARSKAVRAVSGSDARYMSVESGPIVASSASRSVDARVSGRSILLSETRFCLRVIPGRCAAASPEPAPSSNMVTMDSGFLTDEVDMIRASVSGRLESGRSRSKRLPRRQSAPSPQRGEGRGEGVSMYRMDSPTPRPGSPRDPT